MMYEENVSQIFVFLSWKTIVGLKNKFELAVVNQPFVLELLKYDCIFSS